jgi:uncharacterized protein YbbK (DUF523 family)
VSACLLGVRCRYDGSSKTCRTILEMPGIIPVPVCPEQLGGLTTPRPPCHLVGGDGGAVLNGTALVRDENGRDVTAVFRAGASEVCRIARMVHAKHAILKERSPSCGTHVVWRDGELVAGCGVAAAMLKDQGTCVMNEDGARG